METIDKVLIGGQEIDTAGLGEEEITYLLNAYGVQDDARREYHESTNSLEIIQTTGSKGAGLDEDEINEIFGKFGISMDDNSTTSQSDNSESNHNENQSNYDEDNSDNNTIEIENDINGLLRALGIQPEQINNIMVDSSDVFHNIYEDEDELEDEVFETPEEREKREYLESFAIPAYNFSANDILYFKQNNTNVADLRELIYAKRELDAIDKNYAKRKSFELATQYAQNDIDFDKFTREIKKLGL